MIKIKKDASFGSFKIQVFYSDIFQFESNF